jgi:hypothetical protein
MSSGDYEGMGRRSRATDDELEELMSGTLDATSEERELADALRLTRRAIGPPDAATRHRHLAAILDAAGQLRSTRTSPQGVTAPTVSRRSWRVVRRGWSIALKLAASAMVASLSLVGLAFAQVDLPGTAAEDAVEAVLGVDLPNQEHGPADASDPSDPMTDDAPEVIEEQEQEADGSNSNGRANSNKGRARAWEASDGASDAGSENAGTHNDAGQDRADEASRNGQEHRSDNASAGADNASEGAGNAGANDDKGRATAEEKSSSGKEKGETKSEEGKSHKPGDDDTP